MIACSTSPDYSNNEVHMEISKAGKRPMMPLSPELDREFIDKIEDGWVVDGIAVDNLGNFIIWVIKGGECHAAIVVPEREALRALPSCEVGDQVYQEICVDQDFCNENPYIDGVASN